MNKTYIQKENSRMSKQLIERKKNAGLEEVLIQGNLANLSEGQRIEYVKQVCRALGISVLFRPFDYITLNGKLVLYANKSAAEQLRKKHKISIKITARERVDGCYLVTAQAKTKDGKEDESIGAINIKGLGGQALADAFMKCETKAKRRVTLSICGVGFLDEIDVKDVIEREAKEEAQEAIAETQEKIETEERPDYETHVEQRPEEPKEYTLQVGKGLKGKKISEVPMKRLQDWLAGYDIEMKAKNPLSEKVHDDAFHIRAFLETPPDVPASVD